MESQATRLDRATQDAAGVTERSLWRIAILSGLCVIAGALLFLRSDSGSSYRASDEANSPLVFGKELLESGRCGHSSC